MVCFDIGHPFKPLGRYYTTTCTAFEKLGADVQAPPAVLGGSVVFGTHESVLYALNRKNGNMVWRQTLPSRPRSGPLLIGSAIVIACFETDICSRSVARCALPNRSLRAFTLRSLSRSSSKGTSPAL